MTNRIKASVLKPGDTLLFHGNSFIAKAIRMFDGTKYNHAAIFDGQNVVEAVATGVETHTLSQAIKDAEFVGVFRLTKDGSELGSAELPYDPVGQVIADFQRDRDRYAYEQILLLAVLATTRRVPIPMLRWILDHAASIVSGIMAMGRQPMICSELVYRCYLGAGDAYPPKILGAGVFNRGLSVMSLEEATGDYHDEPEARRLKEEFLELYFTAKGTDPEYVEFRSLDFRKPNPNFVTPGDLYKSPDLRFLGYLK